MKLYLTATIIILHTLLISTFALCPHKQPDAFDCGSIVGKHTVAESNELVATSLTAIDTDPATATSEIIARNESQNLSDRPAKFVGVNAYPSLFSLPAATASIVLLVWTIVCVFFHNAFYILLENFPFPSFFDH